MKWDETPPNVLIRTRRLFPNKTNDFQTTDHSAMRTSPRQPPDCANHGVDNNKTAAQKSCGPKDACCAAIKTTGHALIIKLFWAFFFSPPIKVAAVALVVPLDLSSHCSADFFPIELEVSLDETVAFRVRRG